MRDFSDTVSALLRNIASLSKRAAAIAPTKPLWPAPFHARHLVTRAAFHQLGHHLLITTRERLAFRLAVLRCGVKAASWLVIRATYWLSNDLAASQRWRRADELRGNLGTLTDESLETLRLVLAPRHVVPCGWRGFH